MLDENGFVHLNEVTLSFPTLITPKAFAPGQPEKYSADAIAEEGHSGIAAFKLEGARLATEKFGAKAGPIIEMIKGNKKLRAFGKGNERIKTDGTIYNGYQGPNDDGSGIEYLGGNTTEKPDLYDNTGAKLLNASKLSGGAKVNMIVKPWIQDNKFGKAIRCDLIAIQFVEEGESLGGATRPDTTNMFQPVAGAPAASTDVDAGAGEYQF